MHIHDVGERALLVEVADVAAAQATYSALRALLDDGGPELPPPTDVVPAARTVLVDGLGDLDRWRVVLAELAEGADVAAAKTVAGREVVISMTYDGADLDVVAAEWECSAADVVERHLGTKFRVAFCGFAPGFAYCTGDPALPRVPRRDDPRPSVPAGSVALAGDYCGVYPRDMPGGWQLIGTTEAVLFDPQREGPALLRPGDVVRFEVGS
ncbi:MAG: allophanate hydrolase subunit 1 [Nocardioidaceae bacterium]|nr:allophanate hydrolase subunit 1 [Nocardioidaceae bacterium]